MGALPKMQYETLHWSQPYPASAGSPVNDASTAAAFNFMPPTSVKRHAACDECRKRKLKCSGELSGCSRCKKQSLVCHYSVQKQMGRPPKKRVREDDDNIALSSAPGNNIWTDSLGIDLPPSNTGAEASNTDFTLFGSSEESSLYSGQGFSSHPPPTDENHQNSWQSGNGEPVSIFSASESPWPDFSSVSAAAANPFTSLGFTPPLTSSDSGSSDSQCSCLSYLYLCLSHLSSLTPFPISQHTICSLSISAKTTQSILRCSACPTRFDTGLQNVMFTGTLLNVMADTWLRISKADATELGKQVASATYIASVNRTTNPTESWKKWLRETVRHGVIGGETDPNGRLSCFDAPNILSLIEEMVSRQRRWHESADSHPLPSEQRLNRPNSDVNSQEEQDLLCIRVANSARNVIAKFGFEAHEFPKNASPFALSTDSGLGVV